MTAYISTGITVSFGTLSAELLDVATSGESADQVDVTHQASTNEWREFLNGLKDGGDCTLTLHLGGTVPAISQDSLVVTFPTGAGTWTATANLQKRKAVSGNLGDKLIEEVGFKITGEPVWT
jgi:hypothetical protein